MSPEPIPPLLLSAGIVGRVDPPELRWRQAVDLDDSRSGSGGVVVHGGIEVREASRRETRHLAGVELITHADFERARQHGHVLAVGVSVRCDLVTVRHFEADSEIAGRSHGIAFKNSEFGSRWQERRNGTEFNLVGSKGVLR